MWEEIPALGWAGLPLYKEREAVFSSAFRPAESLVCFERREKPLGEDSGAVLEASGRGCTGRARCLSCTASAGSSWSANPWWMSSWGCWPRPTRKGRAPWRGNNRGLNAPGCFWGLAGAQGGGAGWTKLAWTAPSPGEQLSLQTLLLLWFFGNVEENTGAMGAPQERPFLPDPWQQSLNWGSAEALKVL